MQKKGIKEDSADVVVNAGMTHLLFLSDKEKAGASRRERSNDFSSERRSKEKFRCFRLPGKKKKKKAAPRPPEGLVCSKNSVKQSELSDGLLKTSQRSG